MTAFTDRAAFLGDIAEVLDRPSLVSARLMADRVDVLYGVHSDAREVAEAFDATLPEPRDGAFRRHAEVSITTAEGNLLVIAFLGEPSKAPTEIVHPGRAA